jgi:ABC-type nitrate/sulfonate/bicarbonate transport system permease component
MSTVVTERTGGVAEAPRAGELLVHPLALRLLSVVIVLGAWEYAGRVPISPAFPTFLTTLQAFFELIADGSLPRALWVTLQPLALGLLISGLIGVAVGIAMGLSRLVEWLGSPVIVLNSLGAVRHTPASLIEMGTAFLGNRRQLITNIILPSASPVIFAGLRLGAAAGFIGAILAELLITPTGIGDIITYYQSVAEYPKMYAAIATVIVFSVLFIELLEWLEIRLFRPDKRAS